ncbi:MAG: hypothetical protein AAF609_12520 [Cyanobacteria bacterium P01_C01_bin.120]
MKAYRITISKFPGCSIVCHIAASKAKAFTARGFIETYNEFSFFDALKKMQCRRAPEYDKWAGQQTEFRCVDPRYANLRRHNEKATLTDE